MAKMSFIVTLDTKLDEDKTEHYVQGGIEDMSDRFACPPFSNVKVEKIEAPKEGAGPVER